MRRRRLLTAVGSATLASLAGCSSPGGRETPAGGDTTTPTPTATPTETRPSTATETATATPTDTPTPTATPTSTPDPEGGVGEVGEWVEAEMEDTTVGVEITRYRRTTELTEGDLKPEHRDEAPLEPANGGEWVDTRFRIRNSGDDEARIGWSQWSLVDFRDVEHDPDSEAMRTVLDPMPAESVLDPLSGERHRLVFATQYPSDLEWRVEPFGSRPGGSIRIVTE